MKPKPKYPPEPQPKVANSHNPRTRFHNENWIRIEKILKSIQSQSVLFHKPIGLEIRQD